MKPTQLFSVVVLAGALASCGGVAVLGPTGAAGSTGVTGSRNNPNETVYP